VHDVCEECGQRPATITALFSDPQDPDDIWFKHVCTNCNERTVCTDPACPCRVQA
jgi:hypothetical protein